MNSISIFILSRLLRLPLFLLCLPMGLSAQGDYLTPPLITPIYLNEAGKNFDATIQVVDHNIYYFNLRFSFRKDDPSDRARVRSLTGGHEVDKAGKPLFPGVPTPVLLKVHRVTGTEETEIYAKEIDPILSSWGGDNFKKQIAYTELKPGIYKIQLRILKAAPEFSDTAVAFTIGYDKYKTNFSPKN